MSIDNIKNCLEDKEKKNINCIDIGNYRVPKNFDFKDINTYLLVYLDNKYNDPEIVNKEMEYYCSLLSSSNCYTPCSTYGFLGNNCGFQKIIITEKVFHTIFLASLHVNTLTGLKEVIKLFSEYVFTQDVIKKIIKTIRFIIGFDNIQNIYAETVGNNIPNDINDIVYLIISGMLVSDFEDLFVGGIIEILIGKLINIISSKLDINASFTKIIKDIISIFFLLTTSVMFGLLHYLIHRISNDELENILQFLNGIFMGVILYCVNKKYGFKYSVLYHMINNFLTIILYGRNYIWSLLSLFLLLPYGYVSYIDKYIDPPKKESKNSKKSNKSSRKKSCKSSRKKSCKSSRKKSKRN